MRELTFDKINDSPVKIATDKKTDTNQAKWEMVLIESITLAVLSLVTGLMMCGVSYIFTFKNAATYNGIGNFLIIVSLPLFFLTAHCLDKIDELKKSKSL